jgi:hypothetical protein
LFVEPPSALGSLPILATLSAIREERRRFSYTWRCGSSRRLFSAFHLRCYDKPKREERGVCGGGGERERNRETERGERGREREGERESV